MSTPQRPRMTIAELTNQAKQAYGLTWRTMADQLGRSEKMLRKLARGEVAGESYRQSLTELYEQGQVKTLTPRRRRRDGTLAPVRSKRGSTEKSRVPADTRGQRRPSVKRGKYGHETQHLPGGNLMSTTTMPKSKNSVGRKKGWRDVENELHRITSAASQAKQDKRVKINVVLESKDGKRSVVHLGSHSGYHASDVLADVRRDPARGGVEGWVTGQLEGAGSAGAAMPQGSSAPESMSGYTVVEVHQHSFDAVRTKSERKAQDRAGVRRRGRRFGA